MLASLEAACSQYKPCSRSMSFYKHRPDFLETRGRPRAISPPLSVDGSLRSLSPDVRASRVRFDLSPSPYHRPRSLERNNALFQTRSRSRSYSPSRGRDWSELADHYRHPSHQELVLFDKFSDPRMPGKSGHNGETAELEVLPDGRRILRKDRNHSYHHRSRSVDGAIDRREYRDDEDGAVSHALYNYHNDYHNDYHNHYNMIYNRERPRRRSRSRSGSRIDIRVNNGNSNSRGGILPIVPVPVPVPVLGPGPYGPGPFGPWAPLHGAPVTISPDGTIRSPGNGQGPIIYGSPVIVQTQKPESKPKSSPAVKMIVLGDVLTTGKLDGAVKFGIPKRGRRGDSGGNCVIM